jgi:hypothetical protein
MCVECRSDRDDPQLSSSGAVTGGAPGVTERGPRGAEPSRPWRGALEDGRSARARALLLDPDLRGAAPGWWRAPCRLASPRSGRRAGLGGRGEHARPDLFGVRVVLR